MGIPVYLDEGEQVGVEDQPFWYGGLLYVFRMGRNQFRAQLNVGAEDPAADRRFDEAAARLEAAGGGLISIYYHPTEFVTTEFWDAVNFAHGANPDRARWVKPHRRTPEESERCYGVLRSFVAHMKARAGVKFVGADELPAMYRQRAPERVDRAAAAAHLSRGIVFGEVGGAMLAPAEMLTALLEGTPRMVDGPGAPGRTTYAQASIPVSAFERAVADTRDYVRRFDRLPAEVFVGAETLSLEDFAATLAGNEGAAKGADVRVARGNVEFGRYFSTDGRRSFDWVIHREGFDGGPLLELGRLQGWTLKPATLASGGR
jgi:hypothetical protein